MSNPIPSLVGLSILAAVIYFDRTPSPAPQQIYLPGTSSPRPCYGDFRGQSLANGDTLYICRTKDGAIDWQVRVIK